MFAGGRMNVPKVLIAVIDDPSQDSVTLPAQKLLQESNTFAIAVGLHDAPQVKTYCCILSVVWIRLFAIKYPWFSVEGVKCLT